MRGRIKAWTDSFGLTENNGPGLSTEEPVGEELYVMPGWAVAKLRKQAAGAGPADGHLDSTLGESLDCIAPCVAHVSPL
jgi:hypothetical protein